uniref:DUF1501 domain-containing protein n=1 Tax=Odontella aurita TaxID=265563 RepID=A0A7S4M6S7_9STRA|mmetsp:Transcript_12597/g.37161  ORF Transcript_12597/g.37161 Transcript_12597/m.37161 type:complete len:1258 (+) Transcript_12597:2-3775(+)
MGMNMGMGMDMDMGMGTGIDTSETSTMIPSRTYTNDDITSLARAWTGFVRQRNRGNVEGSGWIGNKNKIDPMMIEIESRDRHPKLGLNSRYIGEGYPECRDLPERHFLRTGAKYVLLGGKSTPQNLGDDASWEQYSDKEFKRIKLAEGGELYNELCDPDNEGKCQFKPVVELEKNLGCDPTKDGVLCDIDEPRVVRAVKGIYYEYERRPCVHRTFYPNPKTVLHRKYDDAACADPQDVAAPAACCDPTNLDARATWASTFAIERNTYDTAKKQCAKQGRVLCGDYRKNNVGNVDDYKSFPFDRLSAYHWTNLTCDIKVKIEPSGGGTVAVVHLPGSERGEAPVHLRENNPILFRAVWDDESDGAGPIPAPANKCAGMPRCEVLEDEGRCLCSAVPVESIAFSSMPETVQECLDQLRVGAPHPSSFDNGVYSKSADVSFDAHVSAYHRNGEGAFSTNAIFECFDPWDGRTHFLKNVISKVMVGAPPDWEGSKPPPVMVNPPHFISFMDMETRDAHHETDAVLDQYVYHRNTPTFLAHRLIQRFGLSNPSPRYIQSVATAFRTGTYVEFQSGIEFGKGGYGDLGATSAAIMMDPETGVEPENDPTAGSLREPVLKVVGMMRSLEFKNRDQFPFLKLYSRRLTTKIGQEPHEMGTVFSFFYPDFECPGRTTEASLSVPECGHLTGPKIIDTMNGLYSLIKYGLSECYNGFGYRRYDVRYNCRVHPGDYNAARGYLTYPNVGNPAIEGKSAIREMNTLMTAGRLSDDALSEIEKAYEAHAVNNKTQALLLAQQLIASSPEFHTSGIVQTTGERRLEVSSTAAMIQLKPYKAVVFLMFGGGMDSYNVIVPGCEGTGNARSYDEYEEIRGSIALRPDEILPIDAAHSPNANKNCSKFGLNHALPKLRDGYNAGNVSFFLDVGSLNRKVNKDNYRELTKTQLFSHDAMQKECKRADPFHRAPGTGMLGRMADACTSAGYRTGSAAISTNTAPALSATQGGSPSPLSVSSNGITPFDEKWSMDTVDILTPLRDVNKKYRPHSNMIAEKWSEALLESITSNSDLREVLSTVELSAGDKNFPNYGLADQFETAAKLIQASDRRKVDRDFLFMNWGGFDHHSQMKSRLESKLEEMDATLHAFQKEMTAQGKWDDVVVVTGSDFGRTLTPNSNEGSDHAWSGNYFLYGGDVKGRIHGEYPSMLKNFPKDKTTRSDNNLGRGRMIPQLAYDSIWNAVAGWMGVKEGDLDDVLPNRKVGGSRLFWKEEVFG